MMEPLKLVTAVAVLAIAGWGCNTTDSETAREDIMFQTTQLNYTLGDTVRAVL